MFFTLTERYVLLNPLQNNMKSSHFLFLRDVKAGSIMAPSILWGTSRMQHCTHFQSSGTKPHRKPFTTGFHELVQSPVREQQ